MSSAKQTNAQRMAADLERWFLAISGSRDGVWDWFPQTAELYLSDQSRELIGLEDGDLTSNAQRWMERVYPKDLPRVQDAMRQHWKQRTPQYSCEYRIRKNDGRYVWILSRARATFDEDGRVVRVTGMHTNVTQRVLLQESLEARTREMHAILDISPSGFVAVSPAGNIQYVSPAFERLVGVPSSVLVGQPEALLWTQVQSRARGETDVAGMAQMLAHAPEHIRPRVFRFILVAKAQRIIEVSRHSGDGTNIAVLFHFRDVSLESEVDRMKSEFLANAAHELRTPLASIQGFSEVLLTQSLGEPERLEYTDIVHKQSLHMSTLLNELLDLARIEARRGTDFVVRTRNLNALLGDIVRGFKVPAGRSAPICTVAQGPLFARVDEAKVRQAVLNVLSNAYKYSPQGGEVQVTLHPESADKDWVAIDIQDQGIGMEASVLGQVFERFFRADPTGRVPGTGLGLSIVKEIVELHQGEVLVHSEPAKGTRVSLHFPRVYPGVDGGVTVPAPLD